MSERIECIPQRQRVAPGRGGHAHKGHSPGQRSPGEAGPRYSGRGRGGSRRPAREGDGRRLTPAADSAVTRRSLSSLDPAAAALWRENETNKKKSNETMRAPGMHPRFVITAGLSTNIPVGPRDRSPWGKGGSLSLPVLLNHLLPEGSTPR